jgi:hypothetical protein
MKNLLKKAEMLLSPTIGWWDLYCGLVTSPQLYEEFSERDREILIPIAYERGMNEN